MARSSGTWEGPTGALLPTAELIGPQISLSQPTHVEGHICTLLQQLLDSPHLPVGHRRAQRRVPRGVSALLTQGPKQSERSGVAPGEGFGLPLPKSNQFKAFQIHMT